jgi:hypothetical protein
MKYYSKYSVEDTVWGVGVQYLEYDVHTGEVLRQVEDYGNILLYSQVVSGPQRAFGTCHHAEVALQREQEYDNDRVLERVFQAKWARATEFFDPRLAVTNQAPLTAADVQELIGKFNALT